MQYEICLVIPLVIVGFAVWIDYVTRQLKRIEAFRARLIAANALYVTTGFECHCVITTLNGDTQKVRRAMLAVMPDGIRLYPSVRDMEKYILLPSDSLRWFGRPVKYHDQRNELWLHLEEDGCWKLVKLTLWRPSMQSLIRALKPIVSPELVTAYRRRRPYVHLGPVVARPAEQDIHGAWTLDEPLSLYVMPLYVVILRGTQVLRLLPLERIWQIAALRRLDAPEADGLVSLNFEGEKLAYAVKDYEAVAAAISEAAKRSLEAPVMQKQKKKDEYDDEDWEEWEA